MLYCILLKLLKKFMTCLVLVLITLFTLIALQPWIKSLLILLDFIDIHVDLFSQDKILTYPTECTYYNLNNLSVQNIVVWKITFQPEVDILPFFDVVIYKFPCVIYIEWVYIIKSNRTTGTCGSSMTRVPLGDRHMALSLLLHLALQRATLSTMLTVITLLLQLWDSGRNQVMGIHLVRLG